MSVVESMISRCGISWEILMAELPWDRGFRVYKLKEWECDVDAEYKFKFGYIFFT